MHDTSYANKTEKLLKEKLWLVIGKSIILFDEFYCWVLKSKTKIKQLLPRPCKMEFGAINLTDGWKKWKETMQLYPTASTNGKADNGKYTVLFFMIGEKWRNRFGFWTLLHHFLVKYAFRSVRMGNLHNTILLMPVFHKTPFLVLCFSYHTLIFLMILSVIL